MSLQTRTYFSKALPLGLANNDREINYSPLLDTYNVRGGINNIIAKNDSTIKTGNSEAAFQAKQARCESVGNGDQFDHLSSLASTEDTASRLRCGWVYNNSNPDNGRGAYGMRQGAFKTDTPGQWMWNLKTAQEKYHTAICQNVQACSDIDSDIYKRRCGWCTRSGKAVPLSGNELAYPAGTNTGCPTNNLVKSAAQCPRPDPITDPTYVRTPAEICSPMPNGALARACLLQKVTASGCNDKGTLAQALRSGSDNDYTSVLAQERSFKIYQERAAIPMDATAIKTGKITITDALNTFNRVQDLTTSAANGGLQVAARDLCLNKGDIDQFDFCTELQDNTASPFTLDCLQKQFRRMGGQKTGASYPSAANLAFYNKFSKWSQFKAYVQGLLDKTRSQDRTAQEYGMTHFYGITMQNKRNPLPYGPEIAWKNGQVMVSCQRPVSIPDGYTRAGCIEDESNEMLDKWAERNGWTMGTPPPGYKKVPNVDWPGNDIHHTANGQTVQLCQTECDKRPDCVGYNFIHQGKDCWLKNNLQNRYQHGPGIMDFYIKQPLQCKAPFANPVSGDEYEYKGCYRDDSARTIPHDLGNTQSTDECWSKVKARGFNVMGRQYFGQCFGGNNTDWDRLGPAGCCEPLGGGWTNQVYVKK